MSLTQAEVLKLMRLSKLALTQAEQTQLQTELSQIVDYFDVLKAVDVSDLPENPNILSTLERQDLAQDVAGRSALANSKGYEDGLIRVPKIIEG